MFHLDPERVRYMPINYLNKVNLIRCRYTDLCYLVDLFKSPLRVFFRLLIEDKRYTENLLNETKMGFLEIYKHINNYNILRNQFLNEGISDFDMGKTDFLIQHMKNIEDMMYNHNLYNNDVITEILFR